MGYISEDYCSEELSGMLMEKGYIGATNTYLGKDYLIVKQITIQSAMKWLRENHNIHIASVPNGIGENVFYMSIYRKYDYGWTHISDCLDEKYKEAEFHTPEEACEAGIRYCIENLI